MSTTRATLLAKIRDSRDAAAWNEFFDLYAPLIESYARALGAADAEEIRDACLEIVVRRAGDFRYERSKGSFKSWLHRIVHDRIVDARRRPRADRPDTEELAAIPDAQESAETIWEREWRAEHLRFALAKLRERSSATERDEIALLIDDSLDAAVIAERLGITRNQVYKARSRLFARIREVLERLGESG